MIHPLTLDSRNLIREYFNKYPPLFSECTFSNLFMWSQDRPAYFCEINDTLVFLIEENNEMILFGPQAGPLPLEEVLGRLPVNKAVRTTLPSKTLDWEFSTSPNDADYVYKVSDLRDLPDHKYQKKRQLVHGCLDRYECRYEPIDSSNRQECFAFMKKLDLKPKNRRATERLFEYYDHFDIFGGAIRIEGKIQGYMIAKGLNPQTAVGHAENTSHDFHGLSELMIHWFAKHALGGFTYFNLEQDLGIPGLREAKNRFHPDHMIVKWKGVKIQKSR